MEDSNLSKGKSINLFLMDGKATGRIKCTMANWTGLVFKIPRTEIDDCKDRDDLKQSGVYFLFGISEESGKELAYIGQAGLRNNGEGILSRLIEHKRNQEKDYWTEAVVFTTSDNSFGATEISYLEHKFWLLADESKRYIVKNLNNPNSGNLTEEKKSELEEFVDYSKIVMGALGYQIFEPLVELKSKDKINFKVDEIENCELKLYLKNKINRSKNEVDATCIRTTEGFVVLEGSKIERSDAKSIRESIKIDRKNANIDENGILLESVLYKSPSYAASFVVGGSINGLKSWKTKEGLTLKELE